MIFVLIRVHIDIVLFKDLPTTKASANISLIFAAK